MPPPSLVLTGQDLSIAALTTAARDPSTVLSVAPDALARVAHVRAWLESQLARDPLPSIYGITTGFGEFKRVTIPRDRLVELQENILLSHSAGVGDNADPADPANYFPADVVRAALIIRVNTFLRGHSAVTPNLVTYLVAMINAGIVPLVPTRGSLGSSGDLCPLCHTFLPLLGHGAFTTVDHADPYAGTPAHDVPTTLGRAIPIHPGERLHDIVLLRLRARGLSTLAADADRARDSQLQAWRLRSPSQREGAGGWVHSTLDNPSDSVRPFPVLEKEGLALSNGATYSAAMLALACHDARRLALAADAAAALSLQAIRGRTHALLDEVHAARGFTGQRDSAARIRALLEGSTLADTHDDVQDCYSVRCAPQVHGASRDALAHAKAAAEAEINAACDNPLFFPAADGAYRVVSAGNFHGQPIALAADFLSIALAELANIAERRTQMLLDQAHNRGLPSNLAPRGGLESGLMIAQYTAASLVSENKVLAHPASVDSIPSSSNVEDHVAMAAHAARKLRMILGNTAMTLAIELLVAAAALEWRVFSLPLPEGGGRGVGWSSSSLPDLDARANAFATFVSSHQTAIEPHLGRSAPAYRAVRAVAQPLTRDRVLSPDFLAVSQRLLAGAFSA